MKKSLILLITIFLLSCTPTKEITIKENMTGSLAEKNTEELKAKNTLEIDSQEFEELKEVWQELIEINVEYIKEKKNICEPIKCENCISETEMISCDWNKESELLSRLEEKSNKIKNDIENVFGNYFFSNNTKNIEAEDQKEILIEKMINDNLFSQTEWESIFKIMNLLKVESPRNLEREITRTMIRHYPSIDEILQWYKISKIKDRYIELEDMKSEKLISSEEYQNLLNQIAEDIYISVILDLIPESEIYFDSFEVCKIEDTEEKEENFIDYDNPENYKVDDQCLKWVLEQIKKQIKNEETSQESSWEKKEKTTQIIKKIEDLMSQKEHFIKLINTLNE